MLMDMGFQGLGSHVDERTRARAVTGAGGDLQSRIIQWVKFATLMGTQILILIKQKSTQEEPVRWRE